MVLSLDKEKSINIDGIKYESTPEEKPIDILIIVAAMEFSDNAIVLRIKERNTIMLINAKAVLRKVILVIVLITGGPKTAERADIE